MILLMTPTSLAMISSGFSEDVVGDVIRWHVIAMFAPSFFIGFLVSRFGSTRVVFSGLIILGLSAFIAISGIESWNFYTSLILLGVGWNFCFIGGTSMLSEALKPAERSSVQGANDTIIALSSAIASFSAGVLISTTSWKVVAMVSIPILITALFALLIFVIVTKRDVNASVYW